MVDKLDASPFFQLGFAYTSSRTFLSAVELKLFTCLHDNPSTATEIAEALGLHPRAIPDFPDALVALHTLTRFGTGEAAVYSNTPAADKFLVQSSPAYIGDVFEMRSRTGYGFWQGLTAALKDGCPRNELKEGRTMAELFADPMFIGGMSSKREAFAVLAEKFDFSSVHKLVDIGGAGAHLSIEIARKHPQLRCISVDLPPVTAVAKKRIKENGLSQRITAQEGDFFHDDFETGDVITMSFILHDYGLDKKKLLMKKGYDALSPGGAFVVIETFIDNERSSSVAGLMMSLNMLLQTEDGFDFTPNDFGAWAMEVGFSKWDVMNLAHGIVGAVAYK